MNIEFSIEEYLRGHAGTIYTVQFHDRTESELTRFLSDPAIQAEPGFDTIVVRLRNMAHREGFPRRRFAMDKYPLPLGYLRIEGSRLRLYTWYMEHLIVVGGGGIKLRMDRPLQETPALNEAYRRIHVVSERLRQRMSERDLIVTPSGFSGSLYFPRED